MVSHLTAFFADLNGFMKSSVGNGGRKQTANGSGGTSNSGGDRDDEQPQGEDLDDSRPPPGYGCLAFGGRRSKSMEGGLNGSPTASTSKKQQRRRHKYAKQQSNKTGINAQSLDRLSDQDTNVASRLAQVSSPAENPNYASSTTDLTSPDTQAHGAPVKNVYATPRSAVNGLRTSAAARVRSASSNQLATAAAAAGAARSARAARSTVPVIETWTGVTPLRPPSQSTPNGAQAEANKLVGAASTSSLQRTDSCQSGTSVTATTTTTPQAVLKPRADKPTPLAVVAAGGKVQRTSSVPLDLSGALADGGADEDADLAPSRRGRQQAAARTTARPIPVDTGTGPTFYGASPRDQVATTTAAAVSSAAKGKRGSKPQLQGAASSECLNNEGSQPIVGRIALRAAQLHKDIASLTLTGGDRSATAAGVITDTRHGLYYRKGKLLGKGGFAKCYEMTDIKADKMFAGKIISNTRLSKGNQKEKIMREVELHRPLKHQNVVAFYSFFQDDSYVYMILELCSRKSLVHVLKRRTTLTDPEVRYYMKNLVAGVRYVHSQRIIHRDLKLGNMLLSEKMELKIADFGLATKVEYEGEKKMTVCGTPNYIAPEVLQKRGHSYEADIWALGCIMYALLCGRPPFETATLKETYMRIVNNKFTIPPQVPMSARNLICRLLTLEPRKRPSLDAIDADDYFTDGFLPIMLDPSTCEQPPKFPVLSIAPPKRKTVAFPNIPRETANKESLPASSELTKDTKGSRKYASQIITRTKTPESEAATGPSLVREGYPNLAGSAPSIQPDASTADVTGLPSTSPLRLYRMLMNFLDSCTISNSTVTQVYKPQVYYITKWVDYSNKYGFGFTLSDGGVGVLFNDNTRMLYYADSQTVHYNDLSNRTHVMNIQSKSGLGENKKKLDLLNYFVYYMDNHLRAGSSAHALNGSSTSSQAKDAERPNPVFMKKWFRTDRAIVMYLNNGTLQVNFLDDHTKLIINPEGARDYMITYVSNARIPTSYMLTALRHFGCCNEVLERLRYVCPQLERVFNIDGESV